MPRQIAKNIHISAAPIASDNVGQMSCLISLSTLVWVV